MRRLIVTVCLASFMVPTFAFADGVPTTRRDGFLVIWNSIRRAVLENREKPFSDVPNDAKGSTEITYAKYRGILDDDDERFYPDEPLTMGDALLWLFRTRSVDDLDKLTPENIPTLLERYPIVTGTLDVTAKLSEEDLLSLMRKIDDLLVHEDHEVSLYGEKFHGKGTAFGETFDMNALTAAHRTFPYNTLVKVTNIANGKSVTVRINDRGPYVEGRDMDLSVAAFTSIEDRSKGKFRATFQRMGDATLVGQCSDSDLRRAIRITKNVRLIGGIPATLPLGQSISLRSTRPIVLRSIIYPDGTVADQQDWILPGEAHEFVPSIGGTYTFVLGTLEGRLRSLEMQVVECQK